MFLKVAIVYIPLHFVTTLVICYLEDLNLYLKITLVIFNIVK